MTAEGHVQGGAAKVLVVSIMRTGGTSLLWMARSQVGHAAAFPFDGGESIDFIEAVQNVEYLHGLDAQRLHELRIVVAHGPLWSAAHLPGFRPVAILREPTARAVSMLKMLRAQHPDADWDELYHRPLTQAIVVNHQTRLLGLADGEGLPAPNRVQLDIGPDHLTRAVHNLNELAVLGLMDHVDTYVREVFGLLREPVPKVRRMNSSETIDVPDSIVAMVHSANWADHALYDEAVAAWHDRHPTPS